MEIVLTLFSFYEVNKVIMWEGIQSLFINNCVLILSCLSFSHLQSTLHLRQYTYQDVFPTAHNSFWTCRFQCLLVLLLFFVSPLPHQQSISLWGLFSPRETKKSSSGWDEVMGWRRYWVVFQRQQTKTTSHTAEPRAEEKHFNLQLHPEPKSSPTPSLAQNQRTRT